MGKLILCSGSRALNPYYFKMTKTYIYSIEELCYYIYHNITALTNELREEDLVSWIEDELELKESASKLRRLILAEAGIKDIVVCILLSCDYYEEAEIKGLLLILDEFINLPPVELSIKRAANALKYQQYIKALEEYEKIIEDIEFATLDEEIRAKTLHNMGVVLLYCKGPQAALSKFKTAYEKYNHEESLRAYFFILLITRQEERLAEESSHYELDEEFISKLKNEYEKSLDSRSTLSQIHTINELKAAKESGKISRFYQGANTLIEDMKKNYRRENL